MTAEIETKDEQDWEKEVRAKCRAHLRHLILRVHTRHAREAPALDLIADACAGKTMTAAMALQLVGGLDVLSEANPRHRLAVEILLHAADPADWD